MRNPYMENLRGYWLHTTIFWRSFFVIVVAAVLTLVVSLLPYQSRREFVLDNILVVVPVLGTLFWGHFSGLVLAARSSILPSPLRPIVCVFAILATVLVVLIPAQLAWQNDYSIAATLACVMILFAAAGWWVTTLWTWLLVAVMSMCIGLLLSLDNGPIAEMLSGRREELALSLLSAGIVAAAANVVTLCRLREESRFFARRLDVNETSYGRPRMTGQASQGWQSSRITISPGPSRKLRIPPLGGLLSRAMAWSRLGRGSVAMHIWIAGTGIICLLLLSHFIPGTGKNTQMMIFMWLISMPLITTLSGWMQQWKYLELESLRPITRTNFIREIGVAIAINCIQAWAIYATIFAACTLFAYADAMRPKQCTGWLVASLAINVLAFGPGLGLMRRRKGAWLGLVIVPVSLLGGVTTVMLQEMHWQLWAELAICIAVAGVGILLTRWATQKWLATELG